MTKSGPDVFVIGAGVSGLSTAVLLLQAGLAVTIYAADPPDRTTSAAAGALWGLHMVGEDGRTGPWAAQTFDHFHALAGDAGTGVREISGVLAHLEGTSPASTSPHGTSLDGTSGEPELVAGAPGLSRADPAALPAGYCAGWRFTAPVIAMPLYLGYLVGEVARRGGALRFGGALPSLADATGACAAPVIVNCAGIGARTLVPDDAMVPVRGQVVVVANPGLTEFFVGERHQPTEITYIFPHDDSVVLGGIEQPGNASTEPDPVVADRILSACAEVEPRLAGARVLAHRVGLRPVRPQVRLESAALPGGRHVVHNYGHGGAGVTLSWGCALTVRDEVLSLLG